MNDSMVEMMQMSMDELETAIANQKQSLQFMQDVFALRNKAGEFSTKQLERRAKRKARKMAASLISVSVD